MHHSSKKFAPRFAARANGGPTTARSGTRVYEPGTSDAGPEDEGEGVLALTGSATGTPYAASGTTRALAH